MIEINFNLNYIGHVMDHIQIDKVYTNGTLKIRKGSTSEKVSICRVNPYKT
jgi:hypothetical protein